MSNKKITVSELKDVILEMLEEELDGMMKKQRCAIAEQCSEQNCSECSERTHEDIEEDKSSYELEEEASDVKEALEMFEVAKQNLKEKYMGFKKLKKSIAAKGTARDPGAVAASVGRKKYGKEAFQKAAAKGKKMKGMEPKKED